MRMRREVKMTDERLEIVDGGVHVNVSIEGVEEHES